jgi:outer membrane protein TolC
LAQAVETYLLADREEAAALTEREASLAADAPIELVPPDREDGGPYEIEQRQAIDEALERRLDLRVSEGQVYDAQRRVVVAADALRAELTLLGSAQVGDRRNLASVFEEDALRLDFNDGFFDAFLTLDLPLERREERNRFRESLIALQEAVRALQASEDTVKFEVRNNLRNLLQSRESLRIQSRAVALAERRVAGTRMLLDAGRVEIRDVLDAEASLILAQDALTRALVGYRVAELELQRDLAWLDVNERGMWREFDPREIPDDGS